MSRRLDLREKTSQAHTALEGLIGPLGSIADYQRYLQGMHAFRTPLEEWLSRLMWPAVFGSWRPAMIGEALSADMGDFGLQPRSRNDDWDAVADQDTIFGTLYVLEGSMLGAQLLLKRARQLGLSEDFGARHLALQAAMSENWRAFLTVLEQSTQFNDENSAKAANRAFGAARSSFLSAIKA